MSIVIISLKYEKVITSPWLSVLLPVWLLLLMVCITGIVFLTLFVVSFFNYYNHQASKSDIYSTLFIFFLCLETIIISLVFISDALTNNIQLLCAWPALFLLISAFCIFPMKTHLINWGNDVLSYYNVDMSIFNLNPALPLPLSQIHYLSPIPIPNPIQFPPKGLVRISSSYFSPADPQKKKPKKNHRANSEINPNMNWKKINPQSLSMIKDDESFSKNISILTENSQDEKMCNICCENKQNSVFRECGHGGICFQCATTVLASSAQCSLCRCPISQVLKIKKCSENEFNVVGMHNK